MKKIIIIGAGQLGSRHLQALNMLNTPLSIEVIDSSIQSLTVAQERFEVSIGSTTHSICFNQELSSSEPVDVAIVASTAQNRANIINNLLDKTQVKQLVLEKLLFTQAPDYQLISDRLKQTDTKTWVNCPMRMMPYYRDLQSLFFNKRMQYYVTGSQYGLVTNAIHYLDHLVYLTGDTEFELDTRFLDKQLINSKRPGYFELTGTLLAHFKNGSLAILHCDKEGTAPTQIEFNSSDHRIISREWEQHAWQMGVQNDWQWQNNNAPIPFQSTMTAELVSSLLETNNCLLTDFETSAKIHLQLLEPLKAYIQKLGVETDIHFPFT